MILLALLLLFFEIFGLISFVFAFKSFHSFLVEGKWGNLIAMLTFLLVSIAFGCGFIAGLKELNKV